MGDPLISEWIMCVAVGIVTIVGSYAFINFFDNKHMEKQITQANKMIINHLRSYVVDSGLPPREIINAVKASVAREYNVRYDKLFTTKSLCEEIIKDIVGNSYISNYNQKKYIDMLVNYLEEDDNLAADNNESSVKISRLGRDCNLISSIVSIIAGIVTILSVFLIA
ncbi:hypothetical protein HDR58_06020 [bacterium]|nr:hypothetical protein [bacterium]